MLVPSLTKIWSRNQFVTFLISTTTSFPRWQAIWPSNWKKYKYLQPKTNQNFEVLLHQFVNVFSQCNEIWHKVYLSTLRCLWHGYIPGKKRKRGWCALCAAREDRKTQYVCVKCQAFVCMEHFVPICSPCCIDAD